MRFFQRFFIFFLFVGITVRAQQTGPAGGDVWSLQRCVRYALDHNISVKQDSLTTRLARYTLLQSRLSQLPTLNANGTYGESFGRSINPTTNQFIDQQYNFVSASGNGNVLLFGWMQVRNSIARNNYALEAELAELDQLKYDVTVNVVNAFLAAVLAQEQVGVSRSQVALSAAQLSQTKAFADAGRLPELNVAQLESQLATDSSNLINAISNFNSALLDLKALLNIDFSVPFSLQVPDVEISEQASVSAMKPDDIFQQAKDHFGSVRAGKLRVSAAQKGLAAAKGGLYPQLSLGYQVGTNWASNFKTVSGVQYSGVSSTGAYATDTLASGAVRYLPVLTPDYTPITSVIPFDRQLKSNLRQSVFLNLNVPLFNGWQNQLGVHQAKINVMQAQLNEYNAELVLKQNVYKAHNNALNSIQKYNAAKRAQEAARRALDFARKRYELGLTSTVDLLVTQNSEFAASANLVGAKYDLIFKLKLVDYYMGNELKL